MQFNRGGISLNSESGSWTSIASNGIRHEIKNPFEQAKYYKYLLADDLHDHPSTKKFSYPVGHAVWFPDIDLRNRNLGISIQLQKILLDAFSLKDTSDAITQLFEESLGTKKQKVPSIAGIEALVQYLAPSWKISSTLAAYFVDEERKFLTATKSQFKVISLLDRVPKALISGSAGTGKTLLALEKARLLSIDNQNVLLLCFNKKLADWLSNSASKFTMVEVFNFHGLCTHFCRLAGLSVPVPDPQSNQETFFQYDLPEILMDAVESIGKKYDAIIADEGQDFFPHWWIPIQELIKQSDKETFIYFSTITNLFTIIILIFHFQIHFLLSLKTAGIRNLFMIGS